MSDKAKTRGTDDAWESGELGENEKSVGVSAPQLKAQIDDALGMQMISIRLEKKLIDAFKLLGSFHGLGYQPLMRDALTRFADAEMRAIVSGFVESQKKEQAQTKPAPLKTPPPRMKKAA